ncbi:uncharacterized protein BO80DRAFT_428349 [Aspergillus ibericus CBS 121593]|uniref:Aminoglycoside phosphotransferase domain-containing protein n=1 Tax=Aspergillus ibericus CBS 121593 TaxID=1448316 RepID=A0A395GRM3_9EURO|nr:hypothetical protein BO80DRAFT_428349 [Aspergillus ibericus CBS 121593]RAK97357.1 hypothetical protein BO80DRAFT_428349 [Aspergillus ibericus CBS 121593]
MHPDGLAQEASEKIANNWILQFLEKDTREPLAKFMRGHFKGFDVNEFSILARGSHNIVLRLSCKSYDGVVTRFSQPGAVVFPEEKHTNELAVIRFIMDQTAIPVPLILHSGTKAESPLNLSPCMVTEYIDHETKMYDALTTPNSPPEQRGILNPTIHPDTLSTLYKQMAHIVLQLSIPSLPRIGSLTQLDDFTWNVTRRPLPLNMNELVRLAGLPQSTLPSLDTTYQTSSSYLESLADLHITHLTHQRNDAILSADDCRRKYIARYLFRKLAREKRLTDPEYEAGPFKLWCDDFHPSNVLINKHNTIVGVVDWEFTYAAPVEFSHAPPWWLLVQRAEGWDGGIEEWSGVFGSRLDTFLEGMRSCEDVMIGQGRMDETQRLSGPMLRSWESGDFWIVYAAMNSFAFDVVFWEKIDERFFGRLGDGEEGWKERVQLLDDGERAEMEELVGRKVEEMETRVLEWDPDEYTLAAQREWESRWEEVDKEEVAEHVAEEAAKEKEKRWSTRAKRISYYFS